MKRPQPWRVSDQFWDMVAPLVPRPERAPGKDYRRKPGGGRKPLDPRHVFEAILYVLRTGTPWKALPRDLYGSSSSIHAYFKIWAEVGFFEALWRKGLAEHDDMAGIAWRWHYVHGTKAADLSAENSHEAHHANMSMLPGTAPKKVWRPVVMRREPSKRPTAGAGASTEEP